MCPDPKCKFQKQITLTPNQFQLEGSGFKSTMKIIFKGIQKAWDSFLKFLVNTLAPVIGIAVASKNKNPQVGQATTIILKSISGCKILSLTDMYDNGLRLRVMWFQFQ